MPINDDERELKRDPGERETEFAERMCQMFDRARARVFGEIAADFTAKLIRRVYRTAKLPVPALELERSAP